MCLPDIWEGVKRVLPVVGVISLLLFYVALIILLLRRAPRIDRRWIRNSCRALGMALAIPLVIALPACLFGVALALSGLPAKTSSVISGDGQRAELRYSAGFLGRDYTEVKLKRTGCCRHTKVFWHAGPSDLKDPKLTWLDNRHLQIVFHARNRDPHGCEHDVGDIAITCLPVPWPPGGPSSQTSTSVQTK